MWHKLLRLSSCLWLSSMCVKRPRGYDHSVCNRDLHGCGNGYNPAGFRGNPAGVETEIKTKPAVTTVTGMIFAVTPRGRD